MKTCFVMVGVSGSGKSTTMRQLMKLSEGKNVQVFSLDDCRLDFYDQITDDPKEAYRKAFDYANANQDRFNSFVQGTWDRCLLTADVLFVDNTNLTRKSRARWVNDARARGFTIWAIQVVAPLATVIARQKLRTDKDVPEAIVRDMYMRQQEVLLGDEADFLLNVDGTTGLAEGSIHFA